MIDFFNPFLSKNEKYVKAHQAFKQCQKKTEFAREEFEKHQTAKYKKRFMAAEKEEQKAGQKKHEIEKKFYNIELGMFMGLHVDLDKLDEPRPLYLQWKNLVNHLVFFGTTRFGKTRALAALMRQVILKGDNVIFIDPKQGKNEIISWALEFCAEAGRLEDIRYYSPLFPELCDHFNPIFGMGDEEITSSLLQLQHPSPNLSGNEIFYAGFAEKVLMGVLKGLSFSEAYYDPSGETRKKRAKREVDRYRRLMEMRGHLARRADVANKIIDPDLSERLFSKREMGHESYDPGTPDRTFITYKDILFYTMFDNLVFLYNSIKDLKTPTSFPAEKYNELEELRVDSLLLLKGIVDKGKDYYESVSEGFRALLSRLSIGRIGNTFCTIRINPMQQILTDENRGFVGIFQPNPLKFSRTSEAMTKIIMKTLESMFGRISGTGRLNKRRLWFIIDEGEAVLAEGIQSTLNKVGGIGGTVVIATQSGADFDYKLQPILARVAKDSINTIFTMKPNDPKSIKEMAENLGTIKVIKTQIMADSGGVGGRSVNMAEEELVVTPAMIDKLAVGEAYVKHYGKRAKLVFPYIPDPKGVLEMPKLPEEELMDIVNGFENAEVSLSKKEISASSFALGEHHV